MENKNKSQNPHTLDYTGKGQSLKIRVQEKVDNQIFRKNLPMNDQNNYSYDHTNVIKEKPKEVIYYNNQSLRLKDNVPHTDSSRVNKTSQHNTKSANRIPYNKNTKNIFHTILSDKQYLPTSPVYSPQKIIEYDFDYPAARLQRETKLPVAHNTEASIGTLTSRTMEIQNHHIYERLNKNKDVSSSIMTQNFSSDNRQIISFHEHKSPKMTYNNNTTNIYPSNDKKNILHTEGLTSLKDLNSPSLSSQTQKLLQGSKSYNIMKCDLSSDQLPENQQIHTKKLFSSFENRDYSQKNQTAANDTSKNLSTTNPYNEKSANAKSLRVKTIYKNHISHLNDSDKKNASQIISKGNVFKTHSPYNSPNIMSNKEYKSNIQTIHIGDQKQQSPCFKIEKKNSYIKETDFDDMLKKDSAKKIIQARKVYAKSPEKESSQNSTIQMRKISNENQEKESSATIDCQSPKNLNIAEVYCNLSENTNTNQQVSPLEKNFNQKFQLKMPSKVVKEEYVNKSPHQITKKTDGLPPKSGNTSRRVIRRVVVETTDNDKKIIENTEYSRPKSGNTSRKIIRRVVVGSTESEKQAGNHTFDQSNIKSHMRRVVTDPEIQADDSTFDENNIESHIRQKVGVLIEPEAQIEKINFDQNDSESHIRRVLVDSTEPEKQAEKTNFDQNKAGAHVRRTVNYFTEAKKQNDKSTSDQSNIENHIRKVVIEPTESEKKAVKTNSDQKNEQTHENNLLHTNHQSDNQYKKTVVNPNYQKAPKFFSNTNPEQDYVNEKKLDKIADEKNLGKILNKNIPESPKNLNEKSEEKQEAEIDQELEKKDSKNSNFKNKFEENWNDFQNNLDKKFSDLLNVENYDYRSDSFSNENKTENECTNTLKIISEHKEENALNFSSYRATIRSDSLNNALVRQKDVKQEKPQDLISNNEKKVMNDSVSFKAEIFDSMVSFKEQIDLKKLKLHEEIQEKIDSQKNLQVQQHTHELQHENKSKVFEKPKYVESPIQKNDEKSVDEKPQNYKKNIEEKYIKQNEENIENEVKEALNDKNVVVENESTAKKLSQDRENKWHNIDNILNKYKAIYAEKQKTVFNNLPENEEKLIKNFIEGHQSNDLFNCSEYQSEFLAKADDNFSKEKSLSNNNISTTKDNIKNKDPSRKSNKNDENLNFELYTKKNLANFSKNIDEQNEPANRTKKSNQSKTNDRLPRQEVNRSRGTKSRSQSKKSNRENSNEKTLRQEENQIERIKFPELKSYDHDDENSQAKKTQSDSKKQSNVSQKINDHDNFVSNEKFFGPLFTSDEKLNEVAKRLFERNNIKNKRSSSANANENNINIENCGSGTNSPNKNTTSQKSPINLFVKQATSKKIQNAQNNYQTRFAEKGNEYFTTDKTKPEKIILKKSSFEKGPRSASMKIFRSNKMKSDRMLEKIKVEKFSIQKDENITPRKSFHRYSTSEDLFNKKIANQNLSEVYELYGNQFQLNNMTHSPIETNFDNGNYLMKGNYIRNAKSFHENDIVTNKINENQNESTNHDNDQKIIVSIKNKLNQNEDKNMIILKSLKKLINQEVCQSDKDFAEEIITSNEPIINQNYNNPIYDFNQKSDIYDDEFKNELETIKEETNKNVLLYSKNGSNAYKFDNHIHTTPISSQKDNEDFFGNKNDLNIMQNVLGLSTNFDNEKFSLEVDLLTYKLSDKLKIKDQENSTLKNTLEHYEKNNQENNEKLEARNNEFFEMQTLLTDRETQNKEFAEKIKVLEERTSKLAKENEIYINKEHLILHRDKNELSPCTKKECEDLDNDKKFLQAKLEKAEMTILTNESIIFELKNKDKMYKEVEACHISEIEILMKELVGCKRIVEQIEILADQKKHVKPNDFTSAELLARNNVLKDTVERYRIENNKLKNESKSKNQNIENLKNNNKTFKEEAIRLEQTQSRIKNI